MIKSRVKELAESRGINTPYELMKHTNHELSPTMAFNLWKDDVERFSKKTLELLCTTLNCQPGDLIVHIPENKKGGKK
jgi:DNA-binding Xre family transcriptional regulator